jgi:hypothetical protein
MSSGRTSATPRAAAAGALLASAALSVTSQQPEAGRPLVVIGHPVPDLCPIHRATGRNCPGCGMLRAFALLWRGRLRQAIGSNPASPFVFAALVWLVVEPKRPPERRQFMPASTPVLKPTGVKET